MQLFACLRMYVIPFKISVVSDSLTSYDSLGTQNGEGKGHLCLYKFN